MPATGKDLFGREAELAWLDAWWEGGVRAASVVAFGGVGKSALVNTWLTRMDADGWRGAQRVYAWSFYSQGTDRLSSSDEFIAATLRWFGDPNPTQGSPWDKGERLAALVRKDRTLLILDGVEPLQWGPGVQEGKLKDPALEALVKELGAQNKGLCLITSRIDLADLDGLGGDKVRVKYLGSLSPEAGAALLKARGAKGTDEELREAAREYEGHGLALTLLGSYLEEVAEGDIRRRREIGPLAEDERQGRHARRVMAAYEAWLAKPEVAILRMIGLFDRPVEDGEIAALRAEPAVPGLTDALAAVDGRAWNKAVAKLRRAGLLSADQDKRLDAHPLVREHFGEQLRRKQPDAWREGHRRLYEHLKEKAKALPETIEEMAPLFAAVAHGCSANLHHAVLTEVYRPRVCRDETYYASMALGVLGADLAMLAGFFSTPWSDVVPALADGDKAWVLNAAGFALRALGRLHEALEPIKQSFALRHGLQDWTEAAHSAGDLSELYLALGDIRQAITSGERSVALADRGSGRRRCSRRATLADAFLQAGKFDEAMSLFVDVARIQNELELPPLYSIQLYAHCDLQLIAGLVAQVISEAEAQFVRPRRTRWILDTGHDHLVLGRAHLARARCGDNASLALTRHHLDEAVDHMRRAGMHEYIARSLLARAALYTHTHNFPATRHDLDATLTLAIRCGFRLHEADAHLGHARLALAEGHPAPAREHLATARSIITSTGYHRRDGELATLEAEAAG